MSPPFIVALGLILVCVTLVLSLIWMKSGVTYLAMNMLAVGTIVFTVGYIVGMIAVTKL